MHLKVTVCQVGLCFLCIPLSFGMSGQTLPKCAASLKILGGPESPLGHAEALMNRLWSMHENVEGIGGLIHRFPELGAKDIPPGKHITRDFLRSLIEGLSPKDLETLAARLKLHADLWAMHENVEGIGGLIHRFPELDSKSPGLGTPITTHVLRDMIGRLSPGELETLATRIEQYSARP